MKTKAILALADGKIFQGYALGTERSDSQPAVGEVVFNTSMYGYQEILSDPSYAGQILTFTSTQIGNVGANKLDWESQKFYAEGIIIRNYCGLYANYRAETSLDQFLKENNKTGIYGIDTRALVQHLRTYGAQMGAIATGDNIDTDKLINCAKANGSMLGKDYVTTVSCTKSYEWTELPWDAAKNCYPKAKITKDLPHVAVLDFGVKSNILRELLARGFRLTVLPALTTAEEIKKLNPDGIFLSNGPGDPATLQTIVATVKECLGKFPIFGICLGHQILAQAVGGKTYKLKFGHRGGNHPVIDNASKRVEITCQNHGFAVDPKSLPQGIFVSHTNLNDGTVEGLDLPEAKAFSVQYHPEASPGPHDSNYLFDKFRDLIKAQGKNTQKSQFSAKENYA